MPKLGLSIALGKDKLVRKLANGAYGLWEWYPKAKGRPKDKGDAGTTSNGELTAPAEPDEEAPDEEAEDQ